MRFLLRHETRYTYSAPVDLGAHLLHLTPRPLPWQRVLEARLLIEPNPSRLVETPDCFGNMAHYLFIDRPHPSLCVVLEAEVEVAAPPPPAPSATPAWEEVAARARAGGREAFLAAEFVAPSPMIAPFAEATAYAAHSFPPDRPLLEGLLELNARFFADFTFRAGVTSIATPLAEVLRKREGVCQDFTQLMIACLRGLGLPARYASGYIRTRPAPGSTQRLGADQSHAWVSVWLGEAEAWVDLDPTNGLVVADEHVVLAYGRDFSDISPLAGVILGGGAHSVQVAVSLQPAPLAEPGSWQGEAASQPGSGWRR